MPLKPGKMENSLEPYISVLMSPAISSEKNIASQADAVHGQDYGQDHLARGEKSTPNPDSTELEVGTLYVVATPIGNLEDITLRALRILKEAHVVAAEDTRHTQKLFSHFGITTRLISCHEHNEEEKLPELIKKLKNGAVIALVSDAGTPSVSDPGFKLVREVSRQGIPVLPIPGVSAAIAGLSVSGLPTDRFFFAGFLPRKKGRRKKAIENYKNAEYTLVFYESPKRIKGLLEEMITLLGNRPAMLAREITKLHEEYLRGDLETILQSLARRRSVKGECTLIVHGVDTPDLPDPDDLDQEILAALSASETSTSKIAKQLSQKFRIPRKIVYSRIIHLQNK